MSEVMMKVLQQQVESLTRQVKHLGPENERVRNLLTEFDKRHDADKAEIERLRDGLDAIRQYGSDTLRGPSRGTLDDREWQRAGVLEMTNRAIRVLRGDDWKSQLWSGHWVEGCEHWEIRGPEGELLGKLPARLSAQEVMDILHFGSKYELAAGEWVCSGDCWDQAVEQSKAGSE